MARIPWVCAGNCGAPHGKLGLAKLTPTYVTNIRCRAWKLAALAIAAAWLIHANMAYAGAEWASSWAAKEQSAVRLIAAKTGSGESPVVQLGLQFRLDPGWMIFWRTPDGYGYPPRIDTSSSENLTASKLQWPRPIRSSENGYEVIGYQNEVVLPFSAVITDRHRPAQLRSTVNYLICNGLCIPISVELELDVAAEVPKPTAFAQLINRFLDRVPRISEDLVIEQAEVLTTSGSTILRVTAIATTQFTEPDIFIGGGGDFSFSAPQVEIKDNSRTAILHVPVTIWSEAELAGAQLSMLLVDDNRATERTLVAAAGDPETIATIWSRRLLQYWRAMERLWAHTAEAEPFTTR